MTSNGIPPIQSDQDNVLLSDQFDELKEALEVLYVIANLGGRIQFVKNWPHVADRIFGAELIQYDQDGTQDKARKSELEAEAEQRRIEMLELIDTLEEKSVQNSVLQLDYVRDLVLDFGRDIALSLYGVGIVDRFIKPDEHVEGQGDESADASSGSVEGASVPESVPVVEAPVAQNVEPVSEPVSEPADVLATPVPDSHPLEVVKPIDVSPESSELESSELESSEPQEAQPSAAGPEVVQPASAAPTQKATSMKFVPSKTAKDHSGDERSD